MARLSIKLINLYQKTLSPDHSWVSGYFPYGYCRYNPSCSEYAKQALSKHGFFKGIFLSIKRVVKCNPYAGLGEDPVPENPKHKTQRSTVNGSAMRIGLR